MFRVYSLRGVHRTVIAIGLRHRLGFGLELVRKGDVIKEGPGVVELVIPCSFHVLHCLYHTVKLLVPDQGE